MAKNVKFKVLNNEGALLDCTVGRVYMSKPVAEDKNYRLGKTYQQINAGGKPCLN